MVQEYEDKIKAKPIPKPRTEKHKPEPLPRTKITLHKKALKSGIVSLNVNIKNNTDRSIISERIK